MNKVTLESIGLSPRKIPGADAYKITLRDTNQTIQVIEQFIEEYSILPEVRQLVASILKPCTSKDYLCYVRQIVEYIKSHVKYVNDPPKTEVLQSPLRTLKLGIGDCDDHTILAGTLLRAAGFKIRITLGAPLGRYNHVYIHVYVPGHGWMTVDTTSSNPISQKPYQEREMVEIGNDPLEELGFSFKKIKRLAKKAMFPIRPMRKVASKAVHSVFHRPKHMNKAQFAKAMKHFQHPHHQPCKGMKCFPPGSKLLVRKEGHFQKTYVRLPNGKLQLIYQKSLAPKPKPHPQKKRAVHGKPHPKPLCVCITKQGVKVV
ncbi:transglutaminase-like domain-containing protein [Desulfurobacterium sp.]